jgi:hypothetical protein
MMEMLRTSVECRMASDQEQVDARCQSSGFSVRELLSPETRNLTPDT